MGDFATAFQFVQLDVYKRQMTYLGATPVFVDSEGDTWNRDPQLLEAAIKDRIAKTGKKPKAIVPGYLYGMPAKLDEIMAVAEKYGIPVIEDAAEGFPFRELVDS